VNTDFLRIEAIRAASGEMGLTSGGVLNLFNMAQFGLPVNDIRAFGFGQVITR